MKKISKLLCVMMMSLLLVVPFLNVDAATKKATKKTTTTTTTAKTYAVSQDENAVTIHVFYSETCPHCQSLHEFLSELKEDKDYKDKFNVKDYSVSESLNVELLDEVHEYFKYTGNGGVPYFVIGSDPFEGFGEGRSEAEIKKAIDDLYGSKNYKDVVTAIINDEIDSLSDDASNVVGMVVLGLCVVIIIALIVCSSKNKYYDEEDEDEEEETLEETKKEEVKPAESKKEEVKKDNKNNSKNNSKKKNNNKK